jgi:hypothetical protein
MKRERVIGLRVTEEDWLTLQRCAQDEGRTLSSYVRQLVLTFLSSVKSINVTPIRR